MGLIAFPVWLIDGDKQPRYKGWQSKVWDLGLLEIELRHPKCIGYGLTQPRDSDRRLIDLDLDDGKDPPPGFTPWRERLAAIQFEFGELPATKTTETPGGQHRWFIWPDGEALPDGSWHGFTVRKLHHAKNFVVGPGSVRADGVYVNVDPSAPIATMPPDLARSGMKSKAKGTNGSTKFKPPYQRPETVDHGDCHLEVCKYTLSLWNRRHSLSEMWRLTLYELGPRFATLHTEEHLREHFDKATADLDTKYPRDEHGRVIEPEVVEAERPVSRPAPDAPNSAPPLS